ncbi:MAG: hypothetical protein WCE45_01005 [Sedimentisphaerales bacterium]
MTKQNDQPIEKYDSILGLFAKFFWTLLGNAVLFFTAISIFQHKGEILHTADIVFWVTVAVLIIVRYLDIKFWNGLTVTGLPASMAHWQKYAAVLLICSTIIWGILHAINYLVINK